MRHIIFFFAFLLSMVLVPSPLWAGKVRTIVSTSDRQMFFQQGTLSSSLSSAFSTVLRMYPAVTYQTMDGFGAAVTGSTCYKLMQMDPHDRRAFLRQTFSSKKGLGYNLS